jgi:hypothetical protein
MNYSSASLPKDEDKPQTPNDQLSELEKAQELLILFGDPRQRVSVAPETGESSSEPAIESPIGRRYQVG